jgi:hypothetical protein
MLLKFAKKLYLTQIQITVLTMVIIFETVNDSR